jgi:hypothetical protein
MRDNEREVSLGAFTMLLLLCITLTQCNMSKDIDRIADAAERAYPTHTGGQ